MPPGGGALAACLSKQLDADRKGNAAGRGVSGGCAEELAAFKIDRSSNINKDVPLGKREWQLGGGCAWRCLILYFSGVCRFQDRQQQEQQQHQQGCADG